MLFIRARPIPRNICPTAQVPRHVTAAHSKAQRLAELRQPYEEAVSPEHAPDAELLAGYMAYIKAEEAHADPARVQVGAGVGAGAGRQACGWLWRAAGGCRWLAVGRARGMACKAVKLDMRARWPQLGGRDKHHAGFPLPLSPLLHQL